MTLRVEVDREKCTGLGICESITMDHFEIDDDGVLVILQAEIDPADRALIEESVKACPTAALRLVEQP